MDGTDFQATVCNIIADVHTGNRFGVSVRFLDLEIHAKTIEQLEMMVWHAVVLSSTPANKTAPVTRVGANSTRARTALVRRISLTDNQKTALRENAIHGVRMPHLAKKGLVRRRESGYTDTPHYELTLLGQAVQKHLVAASERV